MVLRSLAPLLAFVALACGVQVKGIGDACIINEECPGGPAGPGVCARNLPNGLCTRSCLSDADCSAGSLCATVQGAQFCARICTSASDCRVADGYACTGSQPDGRKFCYVN